jgi:hypothetical protein
MVSIIKRDGTRGATWRVVWRTQSGAQRSKTLKDRTAARRFRTTLEGLEQAGQGPDLRRGDITLDVWASQVLANLHLKHRFAILQTRRWSM